MNILGAYGGLMGAFLVIGSFLIAGFQRHMFLLKAFSKLYIAKTKDNNLFKEAKYCNEKKRRLSKVRDEFRR